jgi:hypothetical protein
LPKNLPNEENGLGYAGELEGAGARLE